MRPIWAFAKYLKPKAMLVLDVLISKSTPSNSMDSLFSTSQVQINLIVECVFLPKLKDIHLVTMDWLKLGVKIMQVAFAAKQKKKYSKR